MNECKMDGVQQCSISKMICKLNDVKGHLEDFRRVCPNATDFQKRMFIAGYLKTHNITFKFE